MSAILAKILAIAAQVVANEPTIAAGVSIVEEAIAAFKGGDQAGLDAAHAKAVSLADSLAPS